MYPPDTLISCAHGTVRKAGTLAVKNFLVHKKNKKVEPAARRKWKQYWVSLKGVAQIFSTIMFNVCVGFYLRVTDSSQKKKGRNCKAAGVHPASV